MIKFSILNLSHWYETCRFHHKWHRALLQIRHSSQNEKREQKRAVKDTAIKLEWIREEEEHFQNFKLHRINSATGFSLRKFLWKMRGQFFFCGHKKSLLVDYYQLARVSSKQLFLGSLMTHERECEFTRNFISERIIACQRRKLNESLVLTFVLR